MAPMVVDPGRPQAFKYVEAFHDGLSRSHAGEPPCPQKRAGNSA